MDYALELVFALCVFVSLCLGGEWRFFAHLRSVNYMHLKLSQNRRNLYISLH